MFAGALLALVPALALGLAVLGIVARRAQLRETAESQRERDMARERGSHEARLQHPDVDLSKCIGCGACIRACPEDGVLSILHGQAVVVHGARCVGHGLCATACPTGAIALTFGDLSSRQDLPAITEELEAVGIPGLFLAGELTGFALVRTAIAQGVAAADAAAKHVAAMPRRRVRLPVLAGGGGGESGEAGEIHDLLIVGAGPGGLAASLRAREREMSFVTIEQESRIGGTVAAYPRRKLVMTQPVELPLYGKLPRLTYAKEELIDVWEGVAEAQDLPIRTGVKLLDLRRRDDGVFEAKTSDGVILASAVCLALGRRGSPRRLGVPGEDLPKVAYGLLDAESYQDRKILVVGGGDSAIEAALGLAEQPGNVVTLSYRKPEFFRLKSRNETRIRQAIAREQVRAEMGSEVVSIQPETVRLRTSNGAIQEIANGEVFIFAGGDPPYPLLERSGISFDPDDRPPPASATGRGTGLLRAVSFAFFFAMILAIWGVWYRGYYGLATHLRAVSSLHPLLRPAGALGLLTGLGACALIVGNLLYLVKRISRLGRWIPGSLRAWMGSHVFTGIMALLCVVAHSGLSLRPTVGGHAMLALLVVVGTGVIGRYFYAFVPRAANGTESGLDDLRGQLASVSAEWDREGRGFGTRVRDEIEHLIGVGRWRPGFFARVWSLVVGQFRLRASLHHLRVQGKHEGIPAREVRHTLLLARRAYRLTLLVTHYEEVRAILSSWRYFHRWLGVLMVLLAVVHIITACRFAGLDFGVLNPFRGAAP